MFIKKVKFTDGFVGRLNCGDDILEKLTEIAVENNVTAGKVEAIGAVKRGKIGYYDQETSKYLYIELNQDMEIVNLIGNISIKDGKPMVHAHITLGDKEGKAYGGHLTEGNIAFACEFMIQTIEGAELIRKFDKETDLTLW